MKVLVLSVTAGQGHNACAKAVMAALKKRNIECDMLDTIKYIDKRTGSVVDKGYERMGKFTPKVWGKIYTQALKLSISGNTADNLISAGIRLTSTKLEDYILEYEPDAIVCTHIFASLIVSSMRKKNKLKIPVIGINTDFSLHPFWEDVDEDYLVVACDKMDYTLHKRGIPSNQILPFGIPVDPRFSQQMTRQEARKLLNIPDKATLTIMSGSMGFGNIVDSVMLLDELPFDFQMLIVCGNNEEAKKELETAKNNQKLHKEIHVLGFVDNVFELMSASDVVCSKPGGLSVSECMSVGRPLVLLRPIPGLEEFNAAFLVNCGAAVQTNKFYTLAEAIYNLLASPERINAMLRVQKEMSPANAAEYLAEFIVNLWSKNLNQKLDEIGKQS